MAQVTFILPSGEVRTVNAKDGDSLMAAAVKQNLPGIDADCGGACSCATCQVYVSPDWRERVGVASPLEQDLLDFADNARPGSRLSCQIEVTSALEGLVVTVPEDQH